MRTETRPVVEPTVVPSDTNLEDPTSAMPDSSEPKPAPETDETPDEESPYMETDDLDTKKTSVPEPPSVLQSVSPSQLPQHERTCSSTRKKRQTPHRVA